jgi:hypothetical protein
MHFGNASLMLTANLPLALAPSYDVTPMLFAPLANGEIRPQGFSLPAASSDPIQTQVLALARQFWATVASDARVSVEFAAMAKGALSLRA